MRISALAAVPGGAPSAPGEVSLTAGWGAAPGRQFRAAGYLAFSCGGLAQGLSLEPASVDLRGEFLPLDYDALHPPAPLSAAVVRAQDGLLLVDLGGVRRVRRVVLARGESTRYGTLELCRLDGDRPAAESTVTVQAGLQVVEIEIDDASAVMAAPGAPKARAAARAASTPGPAEAHAAHAAPAYGVEDTVAFELTEDFDDARFALRLTNDGAAASLAAEDLLGVGVRSTPLNPRLGLAASPSEEGSDPLADLLLFWPDPTSPPAPPTTQMDAGTPLASALASCLARRAEELLAEAVALPARLDVGLVAASDAPCRLRFDALEVEYHLERAGLESSGTEPSAEKVVLRFPSDRVEAREVTTVLPRGAHVVSAQVEVSESRVGAAAGSGTASTAASVPPPSPGGLAVAEDAWAAQRLDLADPVVASGLTLGVLPLAQGTELAVEVRADAAGSPAGQRLAAGSARLGPPGSAKWAGVGFGEAVLVPSGPVWVLLRAARGRAVWLAGTWEAGAEAAKISAGPEEMTVLRGAEALCSLRPAQAAGPGGVAGSGVRLEIDGVTVLPGAPAQGRVAFDASAALGEALGRAGAADPVPVRVCFSADPGTLLTVYPPLVLYDL